MFTRRERWGLSWRGRVVMASAVLLAGWGLGLGIHPFLAVTLRVPAQVLVVEGWGCWPKRSQDGRFTPPQNGAKEKYVPAIPAAQ